MTDDRAESGQATTRRRFLAGAGVAGTAATSGCLAMLNPFPRNEISAELTAGYGMELVEAWGANKLGGPFAEIRVKPEYVARVDFLAVMENGEQTDQARLGTQETIGELRVSEGLNSIIGIEGGRYENGVVVDGGQIIHAIVDVEVSAR
jgi:hypothetical protein